MKASGFFFRLFWTLLVLIVAGTIIFLTVVGLGFRVDEDRASQLWWAGAATIVACLAALTIGTICAIWEYTSE